MGFLLASWGKRMHQDQINQAQKEEKKKKAPHKQFQAQDWAGVDNHN